MMLNENVLFFMVHHWVAFMFQIVWTLGEIARTTSMLVLGCSGHGPLGIVLVAVDIAQVC